MTSELWSENLTPETINDTYLDTAEIVSVFLKVLQDDVSAMNLKLAIDLLSLAKTEREEN